MFLLFFSSLPHYQAEYLIFRKWLIASSHSNWLCGNQKSIAIFLDKPVVLVSSARAPVETKQANEDTPNAVVNKSSTN